MLIRPPNNGDEVELQPEHVWLRFRLKRLRIILRRVKEPSAENLLRELISDAEERLEMLEKMSTKIPSK
jgi:hypothetical protein